MAAIRWRSTVASAAKASRLRSFASDAGGVVLAVTAGAGRSDRAALAEPSTAITAVPSSVRRQGGDPPLPPLW